MIVSAHDVGKRFEFELRNGTLLRGTVANVRPDEEPPSFLVEDTTGQLHMIPNATVAKAKPL